MNITVKYYFIGDFSNSLYLNPFYMKIKNENNHLQKDTYNDTLSNLCFGRCFLNTKEKDNIIKQSINIIKYIKQLKNNLKNILISIYFFFPTFYLLYLSLKLFFHFRRTLFFLLNKLSSYNFI